MKKTCQQCRSEAGFIEVEEYVRTTITGPTYNVRTLGESCYYQWQEQQAERRHEMTWDE